MNAIRFSIIKVRISIIFMYLRSKLTSKMWQKIECLDKKKERKNSLNVPTLSLFLKKKNTAFFEKRKTLIDFLL